MDRMTHTPDSPTAGQTYKVCYDFDGLPSTLQSVTLHIWNSPPKPNDPQVVTIPRGSQGTVFCIEISTPAGGLGQTIEDTSGNSDDHGVLFT